MVVSLPWPLYLQQSVFCYISPSVIYSSFVIRPFDLSEVCLVSMMKYLTKKENWGAKPWSVEASGVASAVYMCGASRVSSHAWRLSDRWTLARRLVTLRRLTLTLHLTSSEVEQRSVEEGTLTRPFNR